MTSRRERLVWLVLRLDAIMTGAMVALSLVTVPVLWLIGAPGGVLTLVGLAVIVAAAVLGILGAVMAGVLAARAGDIALPSDLAGLRWPGAPLLGERHSTR